MMTVRRRQVSDQPYPQNMTLEVDRWESAGTKDNPDVLISSTIDINGISYTLYGFRVFDPESAGDCPSGSISWEHHEAYGPILWNIEHGQQYLKYCLQSEKDNKNIPQPMPYLPTADLILLQDWFDAVLSTFVSDHTLTPPRIVIKGQPYILTMIPSVESRAEKVPLELTSRSWLPYVEVEQGYKETLIKINTHLFKIKAFEIFEQINKPSVEKKYSTGNFLIEDTLEQHQYVIEGCHKFKNIKNQSTPSVSISGHNYLLFGMSAVVEEEQNKYEKYQEEIEVEKILPQGIIEYRFDQNMPEGWGALIDLIAETLHGQSKKSASMTCTLTPAELEQAGICILPHQLDWLNGTTNSILDRFARWYKKDTTDKLKIQPEEFNLSFEWTKTGTNYTTTISETNRKLLKNLEKGAASRAVATGDPLRIII